MIKINNRRQILNFSEHKELSSFFSHTKGPNGILLKDFVRVYFSSNLKDSQGVTSHILYADFDKNFSNIIKISDNVVVPESKLGYFDEHGIFPFKPFLHEGLEYAFYTGWSRRETVSVETSIGLMTRSKVSDFYNRIFKGPVISANSKEPFLLADAWPITHPNHYKIYYIFGDAWLYDRENKAYERRYRIALTTTKDLLTYHRDSVYLIDTLSPNEVQAYPTVVIRHDYYHMLFCFRDVFDFRSNPQKSYKFGYAFSKDGITWKRNDNLICLFDGEKDFDIEMMTYPSFIEVEDRLYLLYNGNNFGKDGILVADIEIDLEGL